MTTVMCFGTFDLLHIGHLNYFQQAKKHGTYLTVIISRDNKKKNSIFTEEERKLLVQSLEMVDQAILGNKENHFQIIQELQPNIIFLGYDHPSIENQLKEKFPQITVLRGKSYKPELHKSSKIRLLHNL